MSYATKTCNLCGWKAPANEMVRSAKKVNVASGKSGIGLREVAGAVFENKIAINRIKKVFSTSSKRNYTSQRIVWMCPECSGNTNYTKTTKKIDIKVPASTGKFFEVQFAAWIFAIFISLPTTWGSGFWNAIWVGFLWSLVVVPWSMLVATSNKDAAIFWDSFVTWFVYLLIPVFVFLVIRDGMSWYTLQTSFFATIILVYPFQLMKALFHAGVK
mgnify:CR=1 FL=1